MHKNLSRSVMLGVLGLVGLAAFDAKAWNVNGLPVAVCQKGGSTGSPEWRWEGLFNGSTSQNLNIDCSVPVSGDLEENLLQAQVYYTDNSTTEEVSCSLQVRDWDGSLLETGAKKRSGIALVGAQQFFTWNNFVQDFGMPYASCLIPKGSGSSASGVHGMAVAY